MNNLYKLILLVLFFISLFTNNVFNYHAVVDGCVFLGTYCLIPFLSKYIDKFIKNGVFDRKLTQNSWFFIMLHKYTLLFYLSIFGLYNFLHYRSYSEIFYLMIITFASLMLFEYCTRNIKITTKKIKATLNSIITKIESDIPINKDKDNIQWFLFGLLFVVVSLFYLEIFIQKYYFIQDDNYAQFFPVILSACESFFHQGLFPEINPYQLTGLPTSSVMVYSLTYPITYLSYWIAENLLKNELYLLEVYAFIHLIMAYILSYKAAKITNVKSSYSVLYAICYTLSGFSLIIGRSWYYMLPIVSLAPCIIVAIQHIRQHKFNISYYLITISSFTLMFYAGNIQMFIYALMFYFIAILCLYLLKKITFSEVIKSTIPIVFCFILSLPQTYVLADLMKDIDRNPWDIMQSTDNYFISFIIPGFVLNKFGLMDQLFYKYLGQTYYSGSILFCIALLSSIFIMFKSQRKKTALYNNLLLFLGIIALIFSFGTKGIIYPLLHSLPVFNKFVNPIKFLIFINLFFNLGGAIILSKLINKKRTEVLIFGMVILLMILHIKHSNCAQYLYKSASYYKINSIETKLPEVTKYRVFSYAPLRTNREDISATMVMNFPTYYKIPAIDAYDDRIETLLKDSLFVYSKMHNLDTRTCGELFIDKNLFDMLPEYGVKYFIYQDIQNNVFYSYSSIFNKTNDKMIVSYINKNYQKIFVQNDDIIYYEIPKPKPLAFDEKISPLPIEFNTQGAIVDLKGVKLPQKITVNMIHRKHYNAYGDGKLLEIEPDEYNRMVVNVPQGVKKIVLKYHSPWEKGILLMLIMLSIFTPLSYILHKKGEKNE